MGGSFAFGGTSFTAIINNNGSRSLCMSPSVRMNIAQLA